MAEMYEVRWTKQGSRNLFRDWPLSKYRRLLGPREHGKSKDIIQRSENNIGTNFFIIRMLEKANRF
jgi:hypothetical protein